MTALPKPKPRMTVEEFFDWDGGGHVGKLELVHGVVRAQSYASGGHGTIQGNLAALIRNHLRAQGKGCRVGTEVGVVPTFDPTHNIRKPDLTVTCVPHTPGERAFPKPRLVVEVLSPSSLRADKFTKRVLYQRNLVETYWVVDADAKSVEVWTPGAIFPVTEEVTLRWKPAGAATELVIELSALFSPL